MKIGLVGLPKSGKTSLFNLLTGQSVATSSFGTARGEMHTGVARVPDGRVDRLSALFTPKKTTYASFEVVDLAGIAKGDRQGLEAKEFRNADALLHVVRAFPDATGGAPNPKRDIVDLETELILADLEVVERRLERLEASLRKKRTAADAREQAILLKVKEAEVRAWSVPHGTRAHDAAGVIHTDIARGFIRAEVVGYEELVAAEGSMATVRERGQFRLEGKEYVVEDGQVCHFRFNVAK